MTQLESDINIIELSFFEDKLWPHHICEAWQTLKTAVLAQQTTNKPIMPFPQFECGKCSHNRVCPALSLIKNSGVDLQINACIYYSA